MTGKPGVIDYEERLGFKTEVERYLTGKETEPWEIIYFKLFKSASAPFDISRPSWIRCAR
jgi:hypothetical protein